LSLKGVRSAVISAAAVQIAEQTKKKGGE